MNGTVTQDGKEDLESCVNNKVDHGDEMYIGKLIHRVTEE